MVDEIHEEFKINKYDKRLCDSINLGITTDNEICIGLFRGEKLVAIHILPLNDLHDLVNSISKKSMMRSRN